MATSCCMRSRKEFLVTPSQSSSRIMTALRRIRTFTADDIPQVADLHRRVFAVADRTSPELLDSYRTYFTEVYLNNPLGDEAAESLVYQEESGRISGFLAVMPRRMTIKGNA